MPSKHSFFVAAACALPLSIAACGGSDGGGDTPVIPEGQHYGYVVSSVSLPITNKQKTDFALDLGGTKSSKQDGVPDNKLQGLFALVSAAVDLQTAITKAVDSGTIILLVDFQAKDLANASAAGFGVKIGAMPTPAACTDASDMTCRHHLDGHGSFQIDTSASSDGVVAGKIVSNAFTGGPGDVTVQLALSGTAPITLNLLRARVQATISPTGIMNANIGGLALPAELKAQLGPVLESQVAPILAQSCPGAAPDCACTGTAATFLIAADANHDCHVTADEIFAYPLISQQLSPDVCTTDSCTTADGLSIGVQVQAVKAAFAGVM